MKSTEAKLFISKLPENGAMDVSDVRKSMEFLVKIVEKEFKQKSIETFRLCCFHRIKFVNKCTDRICECDGMCAQMQEFINQLNTNQ